MSWEHDLLHRYGQATEPVEPASARVKRQLMRPEADPQVRALLRGLPEPAPGAVSRVRRRLAPRPRPARWLAPAGALAVAAAALGLALTWNPEAPVEPVAQDLALESPTAWAETLADEHVALAFQGSGTLHTEAHLHRITWDSGTLEVEVEPGQGEVVEITTREATVRVVGTAFRVHKDRLGTHVEVSRGEVEVACGALAPVSLTPGAHEDCMPVDAASMLGRIARLSEDGAAPAALLAEVEHALSLDPTPPQVQVLDEDWRIPLLHERVADTLPECASALPHLRALEALERLGEDEAQWLEHCAR